MFEFILPRPILLAVRDGRASLDYAVRICKGRRKYSEVSRIFVDFMGGANPEDCIERLCDGNSWVQRRCMLQQEAMPCPGQPWMVRVWLRERVDV